MCECIYNFALVAIILLALNSGNLTLLCLLHLSVTFDAIDHHTLLQKRQASYNLRGIMLTWFTSHLAGHTQFVRASSTASLLLPVEFGVPQGSVFGLIPHSPDFYHYF